MIELTFLKKLMLLKQANQKSVIFVTTGIFLNKGFKLQSHVCNIWHDLLMISVKLSNIAFLKIKNADYCCIISAINKSEGIKLLQDIDLTERAILKLQIY